MELGKSLAISGSSNATGNLVAGAPKPPKKRYLATSSQHHQPNQCKSSPNLQLTTAATTNIKNNNINNHSSMTTCNPVSKADGQVEVSLKAKSKRPVDCSISILDPLIFDQDTLERIIEHALSDKTNLTSTTTLEDGGGLGCYIEGANDDLQVAATTRHQINNSKLDNLIYHQHQHQSGRICHGHNPQQRMVEGQSSLRSSSSLSLSSNDVSSNADRMSQLNHQLANGGLQPDLVNRRTNNQLEKPMRFTISLSGSSPFMNSLEENNNSNLMMKKFHHTCNSTKPMVVDSENLLASNIISINNNNTNEQEKPMDFSVNKTYEQTGQNIINHLIDKMMGQPNDSPFVMLLA